VPAAVSAKPTHVVMQPMEVFAAPDAATSIQNLPRGTLVTVVQTVRGWTLLARNGRQLGYVKLGNAAMPDLEPVQ
jgi:hypothetical protein